jgi:hypothetical protein
VPAGQVAEQAKARIDLAHPARTERGDDLVGADAISGGERQARPPVETLILRVAVIFGEFSG